MQRVAIFVASIGLILAACSASTQNLHQAQARSDYPLPECGSGPTSKCRVAFFAPGSDVGERNLTDFPLRYLELYKDEVRQQYCNANEKPVAECLRRLTILADYFNPPAGNPPGDDEIALALEGGGTKAASLSVGVLAGLEQLGLLESRVTAIASVSGGTYAASYYYNRWFDRLRDHAFESSPTDDDWFRSCVPAYFIYRGLYDPGITQSMKGYNCGEKVQEADGRLRNSPPVPYREYFDPHYRYIGHVWTNHDLLGGDTPGNLTTDEDMGLREYLHDGGMFGETLLTVPVQFLFRTAFRWPLNTAPSKLYYKLGLEREYGYSPGDWAAAGSTDIDHLARTLSVRCGTRTLWNFRDMLREAAIQGRHLHVPTWVIGSAAPADFNGLSWLYPAPRDPVRIQFELTWDGYGSGVYGYALQPPETFAEFCGEHPHGLPIVDAVVASAAFFDDDQSAVSSEPDRLLADSAEHFINLTWFTDLRNYNVSDKERDVNNALPYPLYLSESDRWNKSPYIHLQDGGNTENSGIFPLLRRGYKTIIYAHGTYDEEAQWGSICHLKNQLELDGVYTLVSPSLEWWMKDTKKITAPGSHGRSFRMFLDGMCSSQLDGSDLASFDRNRGRTRSDPPVATVANLYCSRLDGPPASGDNRYVCPEAYAKFYLNENENIDPPIERTFYEWPADRIITFDVYHRGAEFRERPLSTIVSVVPAISFTDFQRQTTPSGPSVGIKNWDDWCSPSARPIRWATKISQCVAPDGWFYSAQGPAMSHAPALPCIALAHLIRDQCQDVGGSRVPNFPQDDFVKLTAHTAYTSYAAYFDLARNQTEDVLCRYGGPGYIAPPTCGHLPRWPKPNQ
jgi:hypothetical protein